MFEIEAEYYEKMRVVRNYLYTILYQASAVLIPLIIVPYVSRVLGPTGIGIVSYTNAIAQYFVLLGNFGLATYGSRCIAQCRDDLEQCSRTFQEIMILKVGLSSLALLCFGVFVASAHSYQGYFAVQSLLIVASALDTTWFFAGKEDFKVTALRNIAVKTAGMILIFVLVRTKGDILTYILILSASEVLGNLSLVPLVRASLVKVGRKSLRIRGHVKLALIFFISFAAVQVYFILNKSLLGWFSGVEACGFFENSDKVVRMCLMAVLSIGTVLMPRISYTYARGEKEKSEEYLRKALQYTLFIVLPMALGLSAIGSEFAPLFFGFQFQMTGNLIELHAVMMIPMGLTCVFGTLYLFPTNQIKQYTLSALWGLIINIVLGIVLVWKMGPFGAVANAILTETAVAIYQMVLVSKQLNIRKLFHGCAKYCVAAAIMYTVIRLAGIVLKATISGILLQVLLGIAIYAIAIVILRPPAWIDLKQRIKMRVSGPS